MKKLMTVIMGLALAATVSAAPAKYEIKFASVAPDGSTWMNIMTEMAEEVAEKTNGEVKFKFYAGGVLGDEKDVIRKMKMGQLSAGGFTTQGLGEIAPEVRMLNLPLLFRNYNDIDYVMEKMGATFESAFLKKGFVMLGWPEVGFIYIYSRDRIETISDFQKIKMWIWGDDALVNAMFKNLSIVPIPLSITDVNQSLSTGLIEGVYCGPLSCIAMQWNTRTKYMLDLKISNVPGGVLITKKQWDKLPAAYQKVIQEAGKKYFKMMTDASRRENEEARMILQKQGIVFTKLTKPEDIKTLEQVSVKTANDLVGKYYTKAMLDEMLKCLEESKKAK
ncbi:MAG: TRAP transporter substrate-binding protein DctP [Spirochaetia bacterium]|nr:TRAP transporter substrate-binding protein DctP [Spirochaetia bacterium]